MYEGPLDSCTFCGVKVGFGVEESLRFGQQTSKLFEINFKRFKPIWVLVKGFNLSYHNKDRE